MDDYFFLADEYAVRRHLGQCRGDRKSPYERAVDLLAGADHRSEKVIKVMEPDTGWTSERLEDWTVADRMARMTALAAVEDSRPVKDARNLVAKTREGGNLRNYAKAVAARIECESAVWREAYSKAMPKEFRAR